MFNGLDVVKKQKDWNDLFTEVVDETLKQIFKEDGVKVIYDFLEKHSNLKLEDIADKPDIFCGSLEKLMLSASQAIEQMILKNIYDRRGLNFEKKQGYDFSDYILELKENFV
ncbi:MAG: hypothetical protein CW691_09435 [Candidatus Bathyarchaeum sp.]|nr:MAG: hypothetical protein CW691_09435 [Candidatus Bathyarchaeum sp.]